MADTHHPFRELMLFRLRIFLREPETIFWVYVFPLVLMVALGLAFSDRPAEQVRVRVCAGTAERAEALAGALRSAGGFEVDTASAGSIRAGEEGDQWDVAVIEEGGELRYVLDPGRPAGRLARMRVDHVLQEAAGRRDARAWSIEPLEQPGSRYIDWLIPGLLGLNIMGGGMWGVGYATVDMRLRKLLKRFRATPMRRSDFLLSLMAGRLLFVLPEMTTILGAGWLLFDLRIRGGLLLLLAIVLLGATTFAGLGLLLASRAQRIETISGLLNAAMLPMWMLSGVFFSSDRYPDWTQPVVKSLPLTQLNDALREVILGGGSVSGLIEPVGILTLWTLVCFPVALRWFRWQ